MADEPAQATETTTPAALPPPAPVAPESAATEPKVIRSRSAARSEAWKAGEKTAEAKPPPSRGAPSEASKEPAAAPAKPEAKPEPETPKPADTEAEALAELKRLVGGDASAAHTLRELLKYGNFTDAFTAIRAQRREAASGRRSLEEERAAFTREKAEHEADIKLRKENPREWVRKHGVSIRELAEEEASQEPEWKREVKRVEAVNAELRAKIESLEKGTSTRAETEQQQTQQAKVDAAVRDIESRYLGFRADNAYQNLHDYIEERLHEEGYEVTPALVAREVAAAAWQTLNAHYKETSEELELETILEHLDGSAKERFTRRDERRSRSKDRPPEDANPRSPERGNGAGSSPAEPAVAEPPTSLSSKLTAERGGDARPPRDRREARAKAWEAGQSAARKR